MKTVDEIRDYAKSVMSEKRFRHTENVAREARSLAEHWNVDGDSAYLAGLIHDIAKEIPYSDAIKMLEGFGYIPDDTERVNGALLHGPLAAYIARDEFGIGNEEILNAVRFHTTGRSDMSMLEKIIYVADFIEEGRTYPEADVIRKIAYEDIDKAVLCQADMVIKFIIDCGKVLHTDTVTTRNSFLMKNKRGQDK